MADPDAIPPIVIVGAGLAGLFTALKLAPTPVTVISPLPLGDGASSTWAQGGIAAAVTPEDSPLAHARDTIAAGAGLVDIDIANGVASEAADRVADLMRYGVPFDQDTAGGFIVSREAAHSEGRVVRVSGDKAGAAIMGALIAAARNTPSITIIEGWSATEIIAKDRTVKGLRLERTNGTGGCASIDSVNAVVLATGGIGGLYRVTTNPTSATGQGLAMAARAGASIADAEFVQFHPTAIAVDVDPAPLASEALRGDGATLLDATGERFMPGRHPDGELAPRDVVARAVFEAVQNGGAFLDCRDAIGAEFPEQFPTIYAMCRAAGIDPVAELIPVAPAQHYHMGGVLTDARGETNVAGLFAVGEVAATGLHGANRLASNSLLEGVVFAARAAETIAARLVADDGKHATVAWRESDTTVPPGRDAARAAAQAAVRNVMADKVGVVRDGAELGDALASLKQIEDGADGDPWTVNMTTAARFIAEAALRRKESRGAHARADYPETEPGLANRSRITLAGLGLRDAVRAGALLGEIARPEAET